MLKSLPYPSDPRYSVREDGVIVGAKGRPLKQVSGGVYLQVTIGKTRRVHQVVAETFLGPPPPGHEVDHIDNDKTNNAAGNLRYLTHSENMAARIDQVSLCKRGHPFTPENVRWVNVQPRPRRLCRKCDRVRDKARRQK